MSLFRYRGSTSNLALYGMQLKLTISKQLNATWMLLSHIHEISDIPMWVGYQSNFRIDISPVQKLSYLTPLNKSLNNNSTVLRTLELTQEIAKECQAPYIQVTYDLDIARASYCVQAQESPRFDNIFIHIGAFHIEMAFFKAIGTFIEDCGLTNIMIECNLIANGSIPDLISGKNYKKCSILHSVMASTLRQLHLESFLENKNITIQESVLEYLAEFMQLKDVFQHIQHTETQQLIEYYDQYTNDTLDGKHGQTAQFYAMYIDFINLYHLFNKSIREGDLELYFYALGKIVSLLFYYNHENYSRWLVYYMNQLQHVDKTHPGLRADIAKGSFAIRQTSKPFSRSPVDLILKQTLNGSACRVTGTVALTNSTSAIQRWSQTHAARTQIISHVLNCAGLNKRYKNISADQHKGMKKQFEGLLNSIQHATNPFSASIDKNQLYNISNGEAASTEVVNSLLNVDSYGTFLRDQFIKECNLNSERFQEPLKENKALNFASFKKKVKIEIGQTVHEVRLQPDLFGRLLALSAGANIDLDNVLCFPITPFPLSLCHADGSINKTVKSDLVEELEQRIENVLEPPKEFDFIILDGLFYLNSLKHVPQSFGDLSNTILHNLANHPAGRIAIVFESYFSPSINDSKHNLKNSVNKTELHITGPEQATDFGIRIRNKTFKEAFIKFLIDDWASPDKATIIGDKKIYLSHDLCYVYSVADDRVIQNIDSELTCSNHEETATKAVFLACTMKKNSTVAIRTTNTDIVIIMLANMGHILSSVKVWVDVGVGNARRYIEVSTLSHKLGPLVSQALPALHALTGCDFNPAFYRKNKKKALDILMNSEIFQKAFADFGSENHNFKESFETMQSFVCHLYGFRKLSDVNQARIEVFNKTYKVSDTKPFSLNVRNYDACNLPPCQSELKQHLLRTRYIAYLWRRAHSEVPTVLSPTDYGWTDDDGKLKMTWFVGNQLPDAYEKVVTASDVLEDPPNSDNGEEENEKIHSDVMQYEDDSSDEED